MLAAALCAFADEKSAKMKDLPEAVQKTVREQSKGAVVRGLSKETENGSTFYEVELKVDGRNRDVLMDSTGAVVEIEEEVPFDTLPDAVKTQLKKQVGRGKISMVESLTKSGVLSGYQATPRSGRSMRKSK